MKTAKSLPKPKNWQDFEDLCAKVWQVVWNDPEISKNGREGQGQDGVDIFGMPHGESAFYGIQCKCKREYNDKQLSETTIKNEIEAAKDFTPPLKALYIATTAPRDAKLQEFVRKLSVENAEKGLFKVYIKSWDYIENVIVNNPRLLDYYANSHGFHSSRKVKVSFFDGEISKTVCPKFKKAIQVKQSKNSLEYKLRNSPINKIHTNFSLFDNGSSGRKRNLSYVPIQFRLKNSGTSAFKSYKIKFTFDCCDLTINDTNIEEFISIVNLSTQEPLDLHVTGSTCSFDGNLHTLVPDEEIPIDQFYIRFPPENKEIKIDWKFMSEDHNEEGYLILDIKPEITEEVNYIC